MSLVSQIAPFDPDAPAYGDACLLQYTQDPDGFYTGMPIGKWVQQHGRRFLRDKHILRPVVFPIMLTPQSPCMEVTVDINSPNWYSVLKKDLSKHLSVNPPDFDITHNGKVLSALKKANLVRCQNDMPCRIARNKDVPIRIKGRRCGKRSIALPPCIERYYLPDRNKCRNEMYNRICDEVSEKLAAKITSMDRESLYKFLRNNKDIMMVVGKSINQPSVFSKSGYRLATKSLLAEYLKHELRAEKDPLCYQKTSMNVTEHIAKLAGKNIHSLFSNTDNGMLQKLMRIEEHRNPPAGFTMKHFETPLQYKEACKSLQSDIQKDIATLLKSPVCKNYVMFWLENGYPVQKVKTPSKTRVEEKYERAQEKLNAVKKDMFRRAGKAFPGIGSRMMRVPGKKAPVSRVAYSTRKPRTRFAVNATPMSGASQRIAQSRTATSRRTPKTTNAVNATSRFLRKGKISSFAKQGKPFTQPMVTKQGKMQRLEDTSKTFPAMPSIESVVEASSRSSTLFDTSRLSSITPSASDMPSLTSVNFAKQKGIGSDMPSLRSTAPIAREMSSDMPSLRSTAPIAREMSSDMPSLRSTAPIAGEMSSDMPSLRSTAPIAREMSEDMPSLRSTGRSTGKIGYEMPSLRSIKPSEPQMPSLRETKKISAEMPELRSLAKTKLPKRKTFSDSSVTSKLTQSQADAIIGDDVDGVFDLTGSVKKKDFRAYAESQRPLEPVEGMADDGPMEMTEDQIREYKNNLDVYKSWKETSACRPGKKIVILKPCGTFKTRWVELYVSDRMKDHFDDYMNNHTSQTCSIGSEMTSWTINKKMKSGRTKVQRKKASTKKLYKNKMFPETLFYLS